MKVGRTIYLDHQATTPLDPRAFEAMTPYWGDDFGNPHSSEHILGWKASAAVESAKEKVAQSIGAEGDEIIFTSGATEANNLALIGSAKRAKQGKKRILVSRVEHKCVLESARSLEENFTIEYLDVNSNGSINIEELEKALDDDVLLISVMAVNNEIGTIQELEKIGILAKEKDIIFHCDAAQAPFAIDIDVYEQNIDLLSLSAHKFYGPKGVGALYVRRELQSEIEPIIYGGGQQGTLRSGTIPVPLCVGMGVAAESIHSPKVEKERKELRCKTKRFWTKLEETAWPIYLNGPGLAERHPGNINLRFDGFFGQDILAALQPHIAATSGAACTSGIPGQSHVLRAIGLTEEEASASIRFSLGRYTADDDIDEAVKIIDDTLHQLWVSVV